MDRGQLNRKMTAEQFASFDTQLYLNTHPDDKVALQMFNTYRKSYAELKKQFELLYGPISSDSAVESDKWMWIDNPWPWEREAN